MIVLDGTEDDAQERWSADKEGEEEQRAADAIEEARDAPDMQSDEEAGEDRGNEHQTPEDEAVVGETSGSAGNGIGNENLLVGAIEAVADAALGL